MNPAFEIQQTASRSAPTQAPEPVVTQPQAPEASQLAPTNTPINILGQ